MLILDENLPDAQKRLLRNWGIRFRSVGVEFGILGVLDENLIVTLRGLSRPTFFSLDRHFFRHDWAHTGYCLTWLDVSDDRSAEFIRRFVKHPGFDTQAKRMGVVARIHSAGIDYWRLPFRDCRSILWV